MKDLFPVTGLRRVIEFLAICTLVSVLMAIASCKHRPLGTSEEEVVPTGGGTGGSGGGGGGTGGTGGVPCDPDSVYFENTILPLFVSNCAKSGCHDPATAQDGIVLNSYASIMASGEITPFDPSEGDVMEVITETDPDDIMPPPGNTPLTAQQINLIYKWIAQGAKNNGCENCDTTNVTYALKVKPIIDLKCKGCHSGPNPPQGIELSTHAGTQAIALNGSMWASVNHQAGYSAMPKGGSKLPPCELAIIQEWINVGAPNN